MRLILSGQSDKQVAADLAISEIMAKDHRARVMEKMKVPSAADLVRLAERSGIRPE